METTARLLVKDFPPELHTEVAEKIASFSVGLTGIDERDGSEVSVQSGSGTLVDFDGTLCIFTADHVVETLVHRAKISLLVDWSGGLRRCVFEVHHLRFIRLPRGPSPDSGPDLAAIVLPSSGEALASVRSLKTFYNLRRRISAFGGTYPDVGDGFWFPCGVLGEGSEQLPAMRGFSQVSGHWGMCAVAARPDEFWREAADYLDLRAYYGGGADLPSTFGGMSGGGLWQGRFGKNRDGLIYLKELFFSGVIFWQSAVEEGMRRLRSHGRASVHELLPAAMTQ